MAAILKADSFLPITIFFNITDICIKTDTITNNNNTAIGSSQITTCVVQTDVFSAQKTGKIQHQLPYKQKI